MKKTLLILALATLPVLAFAQATPGALDTKTAGTLISNINKDIVAALATLFIACGVVAFFFGIAEFILASRDADTTKMKNGKQFMLWGVISLFVMFSVYGIINFAQDTLFPNTNFSEITIPGIKINGVTGPTPGSSTPCVGANCSSTTPDLSGDSGANTTNSCVDSSGRALSNNSCKTSDGKDGKCDVGSCVATGYSDTSGGVSQCKTEADTGKSCIYTTEFGSTLTSKCGKINNTYVCLEPDSTPTP